MKQQSDAVIHSKHGPLCQREGQKRNHPLCSLESSGDRARKQTTPPLSGNEAKPDKTDNRVMEVYQNWSEISVLTLSQASMNRHTHVGKTNGVLIFGFRKSERKIHHSVCYVQQYCTVHFINKILSAIVQGYLNKIPLSHEEQQMSIPAGRRAETHCCT